MRITSSWPGISPATEAIVHPGTAPAQAHELLAVLAAQDASLHEIHERFASYLRELRKVDVRYEHRRVGEGSPLWLGKDLDPEVWVMTPGRGDVFGFVMNRRQGFFYPWPEPRAPKAAPAAAERRRALYRPYELDARAPQRAIIPRPQEHTPAQSPAPVPAAAHREARRRYVAAKIAAVEDLDARPIWWRPDDVRTDLPVPERVERNPRAEREGQQRTLTDAQRLQRALQKRGAYVVPVTLRPDLELGNAADADWERFEPHVDRVEAPHNILAWDRHYAAS